MSRPSVLVCSECDCRFDVGARGKLPATCGRRECVNARKARLHRERLAADPEYVAHARQLRRADYRRRVSADPAKRAERAAKRRAYLAGLSPAERDAMRAYWRRKNAERRSPPP